MHSFLKNKKYLFSLVFLPIFLFGNLSINNLGIKNTQSYKTSDLKTSSTVEKTNYEIKQIDAGARHAGAIVTTDYGDELWTWGWNENGRLGLGDEISHDAPQKVNFGSSVPNGATIEQISFGYSHSAAVLNYDDSDHLYMWGSNEYGELAKQESSINVTTPQEVEMLPYDDIEQISMGSYNSNVVFDIPYDSNDYLYTWGKNTNGQLGLGDNKIEKSYSTPQKVTGLPEGDIKQFETNNNWTWNQENDSNNVIYSTSAAIVNNELYTWGDNSEGQLGLGDSETEKNYNYPKEVKLPEGEIEQVSLGKKHSAIVLNYIDNGEINSTDHLYTWGDNSKGQLGLGDTYPEKTNSPKLVEDLPFGNIEQISLGENYSTAVINGENNIDFLYTWGDNSEGQLGQSNDYSQTINSPKIVTTLPQGDIEQISTGNDFSLALIKSGEKQLGYAWGNNNKNQLGSSSYGSEVGIPIEVFSTSYVEPNNDFDIESAFQLDLNNYREVKISYSFIDYNEIPNIKIDLKDMNTLRTFTSKTSIPNSNENNKNLYSGEVVFNGLENNHQYEYTITPINKTATQSGSEVKSSSIAKGEFYNSKFFVPEFQSFEAKEIHATTAEIEFTYSYLNSESSYDDLSALLITDDQTGLEEIFSSNRNQIKIVSEDYGSKTVSITIENLTPKTIYNLTLDSWFVNPTEKNNFQKVSSSPSQTIQFETNYDFKQWYHSHWYYFLLLIIVILFIFIFITIVVIKQRRGIVR